MEKVSYRNINYLSQSVRKFLVPRFNSYACTDTFCVKVLKFFSYATKMVKIYKIDLSNIIYVANFVQIFFLNYQEKKTKIIINFSVITRNCPGSSALDRNIEHCAALLQQRYATLRASTIFSVFD